MPEQQTLSFSVFKSHESVRLRVVFARDESVPPYLVKVIPGGAAAESGLEVGDTLLEIDGEPTTTPYLAAATLRERSGTITIKALRTIFTAEDLAATLVAARWRGFEQREVAKSWKRAATQIQRFWRGTLARWCVAFWRDDCAVTLLQSYCRGRLTRIRTASMLAAAEKKRKPLDKKEANQVRRALSFNRKPRKRGKDGGEFSALLEGSPEDIEARLLMRQQQTARVIEKAMVGVNELAPAAPSEAEMCEPLVVQAYMLALGAYSFRQEAVINEHAAAVRENRWVGEQLVRITREAKREEQREAVEQQKRVRRALSFERAKNRHKQHAPPHEAPQLEGQHHEGQQQHEGQQGAEQQQEDTAVPHEKKKTEGKAAPLQEIQRKFSFERRKQPRAKPPPPVDADERDEGTADYAADSPQSVLSPVQSNTGGDTAPQSAQSAKYKQRLSRARTANQLRAVSSPAIVPALVHPVNA